jgi:hypothetical protein
MGRELEWTVGKSDLEELFWTRGVSQPKDSTTDGADFTDQGNVAMKTKLFGIAIGTTPAKRRRIGALSGNLILAARCDR